MHSVQLALGEPAGCGGKWGGGGLGDPFQSLPFHDSVIFLITFGDPQSPLHSELYRKDKHCSFKLKLKSYEVTSCIF